MLSLVLQNLENLQVRLAAIDPDGQMDVADVVADMAVALRYVLANDVRLERQSPAALDASKTTRSHAAA